MSRSHKHSAFSANAGGGSEHRSKRQWHKRMRTHQRGINSRIMRAVECPDVVSVTVYDVSNVATMPKEGAHYWPLHEREAKAKELTAHFAPDERYKKIQQLLAKWDGK